MLNGANSFEVAGMSACGRSNIMRWQRVSYPIVSLMFLACICMSCTSGGNSGDNSAPPLEVVDMELIGSWAGYFLSGDSVYDASNDPLDPDNPDRIFVIGIITRGPGARFIGDCSQFVCFEDSTGIYDHDGYSKTFTSEGVYYYTWNTQGPSFSTHGPGGDDYLANVQYVGMAASTLYSNDILDGIYYFESQPSTYWEFQLLNYTSAEIFPDVKKLGGTWKINNSFVYGRSGANYLNTLTLVLDTNGIIINGSDTFGNVVTGSIEEIVYNVTSDTVPYTEIYGVNLQLNGSVDLEGLATYIETMDSGGIVIEKALAIGATNSNHLITGIAQKVEE